MIENDCIKIIKFHELCCKLKNIIRTGWKLWHVESDRLESIAEHVYGCCILAVGILSVKKDVELDENKVITMIALHEMEEIIIGDITPHETDKMKTKKIDGECAIKQLFADLNYPNNFTELIAEFEENKTPEAKFARMCDKLEADLQAYQYEEFINYEKIDEKMYQSPIVIEAINEGGGTVSDFFAINSEKVFDEDFKNLIKTAKKYYNNKD